MSFLRVLVFALLGVMAARLWIPTHAVFCWIELMLFIFFLYIIVDFYLLCKNYYSFRLRWSIMLQIWISLAFYFLASKDEPHLVPNHFSNINATWFVGAILSEPIIKNDRARFTYRVDLANTVNGMQHVNGVMMMNLPIQEKSGGMSLKYLDRILLPASWKAVSHPKNPEELDYRFHLIKANIWHQSYLNEQQIYRVYKNMGASLIAWSLELREKMVRKMSRFMDDQTAFAIASTLILGYRAELGPDIMRIFSVTGTIHVLSVSGMHVVLVFLLFDRLLWWLGGSKAKNTGRYILLIASIWMYALISGLSPSVLRASAMLSFVLIGKGMGRQGNMYNSLCVSAFFILSFSPKLLWDLGFQLSYLAVFFIVFCQSIWIRIWDPANSWIKSIWSYAGMSVAAQLGSGPLATFYFKQFPIYFLLANLGIALPATAIMYLGFLLLLSPFDLLSGWVGAVLQFVILWMNYILEQIAEAPYSSVVFRSLNLWEILFIYASVIAFVLWYIRKSFLWLRIAFLLLVLLAMLTFHAVKERVLKRKILVHSVGNNLAITYASLKQVYLYTNLANEESSTYTYNILPYIRDIKMGRNLVFIQNEDHFSNPDLICYDNLFWLPDFVLMIWDRNRKSGIIQGPIQMIVLRHNATIGLEQVLKEKRVDMLVIDPSNSEYTIDKVLNWCEAYGQRYYVLKDNFAYFWELKDHRSCNQ